MGLLKKENWIINCLMMIFTFGGYILIPAYQLKLFEKDKWYSNYKYWLCGTLLLVFPVIIMLLILVIQMTIKVASYMKVNGSFIYENVYIWIALLIVPIVGWCLLIVMYIYLHFSIIVKIKKGTLKIK